MMLKPATPKKLRELNPPLVGSSVELIIEYQEKVSMRAQYALVPHGSRHDNGAQDYRCPAGVGKLRCHLVSKSMKLPPAITTAISAPVLGGTGPLRVTALAPVCSQATKGFQAIEVPLAQRDLYG